MTDRIGIINQGSKILVEGKAVLMRTLRPCAERQGVNNAGFVEDFAFNSGLLLGLV
jgi:hypothetical protein